MAHLEVARDGTILRTNRACAEVFKTPVDELVGNSLAKLFSQDAEDQKKVARILQNPSAPGDEIAFVRGDGSRRRGRFIAWTANPSDDTDPPHEIIITDIRETGREAASTEQEMSQGIQDRDDFLSVASHELRTPLSALVLQLATLRRAVAGSQDVRPPRDVVARIDNAIKSTDRLTALVDSLLDVSRIATGRLQLQLEECDLTDITKQLVAQMAPSAHRAGVELRYQVNSQILGMWDRARVERILQVLVSNAIKYGESKPVDIIARRDDGRARITVHDHGIGIPRSDLQRIFDRFERAVPSRHYGGLGLGLYIAREIVEAHGGTIDAQSEPDAGTRFEIDLPLVRPPRPQTSY